MDRLINTMAYLIANLQIFWGKPATNAFMLQICVESLGEGFIVAGVADEARVVVNGITGSLLTRDQAEL